MSPNTLVINCDLRETRVALIEDGVIAELQIERAAQRGTVGNIVLGKVSRVLPGMQAAFIDVGMERAAFLHVEDLIRPDDFEAYLAGDFGEIDKTDSGKDLEGPSDGDSDSAPLIRKVVDDDESDEDEDDDDDDEDFDDDDSDDDDSDDDDDDEGEDEDFDDEDSDDDEDDDDDDDDAEDFDDDDSDDDDDAGSEDDGADGDFDDEEEGEAVMARSAEGLRQGRLRRGRVGRASSSPPPDEEEEEEDRGRSRRRRRRRRTSGGSSGNKSRSKSKSRSPARSKSKSDNGKKNGRSRKNGRVSRSVPITDVVKEGDMVIVQISKEPIGTKGARVTSHVSLPGRYCVYLPTVEHVGISKRIGSASERARLRKVIEALKPKSGGVIVRTVAAGLTKKALKADLGYLMRLWSDVSKRVEEMSHAKKPTVLYTELDLVLKTARDLFTDDIQKIVIDDKEQYARLVRFVEMFSPDRVKDIELYQGDEPIFDAYGIEDEITRALSRKVPLPSGGYLIIDQAEALTAIDVNTGRFIGKGSANLEETAVKTNLEAVDEIAYQLRFRNVGGLVVLDLIDMEDRRNREKVYRTLDQALKKDKAKTTINRISELGLIEMTRKRTRESLSRTMHEPCFYCDGTGHIQSRTTIAYEILRQLRREREVLPGYSIMVNAHPAVVDVLQGEEKEVIREAEAKLMRRIKFQARKEYHIEQFDLRGE